ncbi:phosphoglucosamine mutase [Ruminococcaceae bacterium OttesenSCG-928-O06]|nr:phosphoglucosamine mutase [Ruminococcaceae bacterium OttesenSCG-928-O06]
MARLFGTDGVRGIANEEMTAELAMSIGRAAAAVLTQGRRRRPLVVIGKDTRLSSDMLESALAAGLCSVGADVIIVGVMPTPAVAFLVKQYKADAGIMISASHNPYPYNGIKIFSGDGFKLPDDLENRIEALVLDEPETITFVKNELLGTMSYRKTAAEDYVEHLTSTVPTSLEGLHIAVDCANGSASATAAMLFERLGATVDFLACEPDGVNINQNCGSTHMEALQAYVVEHKLDAGVAFDGDADRCLCVDEKGNIVDGDFIIAICALDMKQRGKLRRDTVVGTVMANMGFTKFCEENDIRFVATKVGDRYVLEEMELEGYRFGGEQSGHVIFRDYSTTGDGQLTAIQLLCHLRRSGKTLSQLAEVMVRYPQQMVNVQVSPSGKLAFYNNEAVRDVIEAQKALLGDSGRVLVRVSGTEPLIRVMAEGLDEKAIRAATQAIAKVVKAELV